MIREAGNAAILSISLERFNQLAAPFVLTPHAASFWVGSDGTNLYIAVVSETPPGGQLLARFVPLPQDGDARTWLDDSIELVLDPLRHDPLRRRLYHANINAKGAINDTAYKLAGGGEAWRGHWRIANQTVGDRWHFEAALPLADLGSRSASMRTKPRPSSSTL